MLSGKRDCSNVRDAVYAATPWRERLRSAVSQTRDIFPSNPPQNARRYVRTISRYSRWEVSQCALLQQRVAVVFSGARRGTRSSASHVASDHTRRLFTYASTLQPSRIAPQCKKFQQSGTNASCLRSNGTFFSMKTHAGVRCVNKICQ